MTSPVKIWRNQKKVADLLGKQGRIVSWTMIRVPPGGFTAYAPYPVAIVRLDDGVNHAFQVVDWEEQHLRVGQIVDTVLRRVKEPDVDGVIQYGIKAKPAKE